MTEQDNTPELVATVTPVADPLRSAFAHALRAIVEALPPSRARDIAVEQVIAAHTYGRGARETPHFELSQKERPNGYEEADQ